MDQIATMPQVVIFYSTYTPAVKEAIKRYRATPEGHEKALAAQRRYYANSKLRKLAKQAELEEALPI